MPTDIAALHDIRRRVELIINTRHQEFDQALVLLAATIGPLATARKLARLAMEMAARGDECGNG